MLSYTHGPGSIPLLGETIGANLRRTVARFPDRDALVVRADEIAVMARALLASGIEAGDRVGIWAPNRYEWVIAQYATARVGAILVNINPAYRAAELRYALRQSGARLLFLARAFKKSDYVEMLGQVRAECEALREAVVLEDDWESFLSRSASKREEDVATREALLQFDDAINIQYTSGTTGAPKGATLTHHNILNNGFFVGEALGYSEVDRVCVPVPFYHCFGMVLGNLACTTHGSCIVTPGEAFDPLLALEAVSAERCTSLYGVPTMFIAELNHPRFSEFDLSSLRTGIMAGAPCPIEVMRKVQAQMHMPEVTICYGMTETSPVSMQTSREDPLERRVSTVGRAHPHVEAKVVDPESGRIVERGQPGEYCARGYPVMAGYWEDEMATRKAIDGAGWMHSGDLATMDEAGYVKIVGRIKDMIIRGGENISPREIEELLHTHPEVLEAQVIGIPSERYGEEVMAWVRLKPDAGVTATGLEQYCAERIASFKVPRHWKFVEEFPLTVTGKVQKFRMREAAIVELALQKTAGIATA
jgi:fatty-acyl-CoA synthase